MQAKILVGLMAFYYLYIVALGMKQFLMRKKAIVERKVSTKYFRLYQGEIDERLLVMQNHFNNQFQLPLVFMAVCLLTLVLKNATWLTSGLAIVFVLSRMVHTYIHLGTNNVLHRAYAYFFGVIVIGIQFLVNISMEI